MRTPGGYRSGVVREARGAPGHASPVETVAAGAEADIEDPVRAGAGAGDPNPPGPGGALHDDAPPLGHGYATPGESAASPGSGDERECQRAQRQLGLAGRRVQAPARIGVVGRDLEHLEPDDHADSGP